jgi:error-prone DNA polymerase
VLVRQRPGTASGVVFVTIEDEHGIANLVVWPGVFERYRRVVMGARLLGVRGRIQREGLVIHLVAEQLWDWSADLDSISELDDFRLDHGRGDQARSSSPDPRDQPRPRPAKPATRKAGYDRSRIALDRPRIKIASRDFH